MENPDNNRQKYYYWVGKDGYVFSSSPILPVRKGNKFKYSYLGYTYDTGWPKKMNTGRLLYKNR